jgi:hypothetical protein
MPLACLFPTPCLSFYTPFLMVFFKPFPLASLLILLVMYYLTSCLYLYRKSLSFYAPCLSFSNPLPFILYPFSDGLFQTLSSCQSFNTPSLLPVLFHPIYCLAF